MGAGSVAKVVGSGGMLVDGGVSVWAGADGVAVPGVDVAVVVASGVAVGAFVVGAPVVAVELTAAVGLLMLAVGGDEQPAIVSSTNA